MQNVRYFNPRSHEGSDHVLFVNKRQCKYFNPRSHEGSDVCEATGASFYNISIHAPTRGATQAVDNYEVNDGISIHAPTRGATMMTMIGIMSSKFQSTLPRGERRSMAILVSPSQLFQSTLPRGERHTFFDKIPFSPDFNPRSHEGSDTMQSYWLYSKQFQSTLPRGERRLVYF